MKRFMIMIFVFMISISGYTQDDTTEVVDNTTITEVVLDTIFPQPYYVNGEMIGVLFTIEQARKIDNDYELFYLMDSIISEYGINDSLTIGIMNAQGEKIKNLEMQVSNCDSLLNNRGSLIRELKTKLTLYDEEIKIMKEKEESYIEETKALKKEVKKQKRQKIIGYIVSGVIIVLVILI